VDLAEVSTLYNFPRTIQFTGYRGDGSAVTMEFTTDGVIDGTGPLADFQTFYFDNRFSDLIRFEVPTTVYAMDNLVYFIPEPSSGLLIFMGGAILCFVRIKRTRRR
jgi:hypothetical protein